MQATPTRPTTWNARGQNAVTKSTNPATRSRNAYFERPARRGRWVTEISVTRRPLRSTTAPRKRRISPDTWIVLASSARIALKGLAASRRRRPVTALMAQATTIDGSRRRQKAILAPITAAAHDVVAFLHGCHQPGDVAWIELQVGIKADEDLPLRVIQPRHQGRRAGRSCARDGRP